MTARNAGTKLLLVGVDGLDFDVVLQLGDQLLPTLHRLVSTSIPHGSTFPPDSVPSWTTIFTGLPPHLHGQLHSKNYILDRAGSAPTNLAGLDGLQTRCFWHALPPSATLAVINPFLAYPPFPPNSRGAMVSAPSFTEGPALVADPMGRLAGNPPSRMGGFTTVPRQRHLEAFATETAQVAAAQYEYSLRQLSSRAWDVVFHTNLTVDRIQHFAWRHFDSADPTHPGDALAHVVPDAYRQLESFLREAESLMPPSGKVAVFSDHGHGPRAHIGVNLLEIFRRAGLYIVDGSSVAKRGIEAAKTALLSGAPLCHAEAPVIWLAKWMPGKTALKSGAVAGKPNAASLRVPDLAGSNPFGGVATGGDDSLTNKAVATLSALTYRGVPVTKWVGAAEEVLGAPPGRHYPDVLFEFHPQFAPTWNMYGPCFAPIITRRRLSGGHTRRGVFATNVDGLLARDSLELHGALMRLCEHL